MELRAKWVIDCSGRRTVLGRQLGITHPVKSLDTAAVWNRFEGVNDDPAFWRTFHGVDRRRHTIHFCGHGFWFWWIHQRDNLTSVGVSYDKEQHQPDVKTDDRGFWEMVAQVSADRRRARAARARSSRISTTRTCPISRSTGSSTQRYALIGDAAWFTDALYSIGIETSCRQLTMLAPIVVDDARGDGVCDKTIGAPQRGVRATRRRRCSSSTASSTRRAGTALPAPSASGEMETA